MSDLGKRLLFAPSWALGAPPLLGFAALGLAIHHRRTRKHVIR